MHAITWIESHFDPRVKSHRDAYGLMQMTHVAMLEAAAYCHLPVLKSMDRLYDIPTNIQYGTCYFKFLVDASNDDYTRALIIYNGGFRALQMYDKGVNLPNETAQYVLAVDRVRKLCSSPILDAATRGN